MFYYHALGKDECEQGAISLQSVENSKLLLKCLIILCRNPDNIPLVSSMSFIQLITQMDSLLLQHLLEMESMFFGGGRSKAKAIQAQTQKLRTEIMGFIEESCHLLECIYDPYFRWRVFLFGKDHEKGCLGLNIRFYNFCDLVSFF